jgi:hypothetical protein
MSIRSETFRAQMLKFSPTAGACSKLENETIRLVRPSCPPGVAPAYGCTRFPRPGLSRSRRAFGPRVADTQSHGRPAGHPGTDGRLLNAVRLPLDYHGAGSGKGSSRSPHAGQQ